LQIEISKRKVSDVVNPRVVWTFQIYLKAMF